MLNLTKVAHSEVFKNHSADYIQNLNNYYLLATDAYNLFFGEHFHLFIWDKGQSREEAIKKTNQMFFIDGRLNKNSQVIDLGCGIGSLSILAAKSFSCSVTGINASSYQINIARERVKKDKLNVQFLEQDIMKLNLEQKFDTAFYIDVDPHIPDKSKAIKNIKKILKPGGRIIMTAWLTNEKPSFAQKEFLIKPFCRLTAFPYMESFRGYKKIFTKEGLKIIKFQDITDKTRKSVDDLYFRAFEEVKNYNSLKGMAVSIANGNLRIMKILFKNFSKGNLMKLADDMVLDLIYTKVCMDAGVFKIGYFVVEK